MRPEQATVEFYDDERRNHLVAVVCMPRKGMEEYTRTVGRVVCKINRLNSMDAALLDEDGDEIGQMAVYR